MAKCSNKNLPFLHSICICSLSRRSNRLIAYESEDALESMTQQIFAYMLYWGRNTWHWKKARAHQVNQIFASIQVVARTFHLCQERLTPAQSEHSPRRQVGKRWRILFLPGFYLVELKCHVVNLKRRKTQEVNEKSNSASWQTPCNFPTLFRSPTHQEREWSIDKDMLTLVRLNHRIS